MSHRFTNPSQPLHSCAVCGLYRRRHTKKGWIFSWEVEAEWFDGEPPCEPMVALKPWKTRRFVSVDVETTGLDCAIDEIVEIALIGGRLEKGVGDKLVVVEDEVFHTLIRPRPILMESYSAAAAITGITWEQLKKARYFPDVAKELGPFIERWNDAIFLAFNARFDHAFIYSQFLKYGFAVPPCVSGSAKLIDPCSWSRGLDRYTKGGHKLTTIGERYKLLTAKELADGAHRADFDARLAFRVFAHFSNDARVPEDLDELFDWQEAQHANWASYYFGTVRPKIAAEKRAAALAEERERLRVFAEIAARDGEAAVIVGDDST